MTTPSFLYSGLDQRTRSLQADLDELGGGDSRTANVDLHIVIDDIKGRRKSKILWQLDNFVGLRDPQMTSEASVSANMNYYSATTCQTISEVLSSDGNNCNDSSSSGSQRGRGRPSKPLHVDIADWSLSGYNNCIISYGARGSGKTLTLFGPNAQSTRFPKCLCKRILEHLYSKDNVTIGMSCWALRRNQVIDLCEDYGKSPRNNNNTKGFAIIECMDIKTALQVLYSARAKCEGVEAIDPYNNLTDSKRAHFFLRITLYMPNEDDDRIGKVSHIHMVDLIGTSPIENRSFNELSEDDKECRREVSSQHAALAKILQQMKSASERANTEGETLITPTNPLQISSARDSKLTMMLAPLIQGNVRTSIMLFLKDHETQFKHSKSALMSLRDINETVSACYVNTTSIEKTSLEMRHPDRVLSPKPQYYSTLQKYWQSHGTQDNKPSSTVLVDLLQSSQAHIQPNKPTPQHSKSKSPDQSEELQSLKEKAPRVSQDDPLMNDVHDLISCIDVTVDDNGNDNDASSSSSSSSRNVSNSLEQPTLMSLAAEPMEQYSSFDNSNNSNNDNNNENNGYSISGNSTKFQDNNVGENEERSRSPYIMIGSGHHPSSSGEDLDAQDQMYGTVTTQSLMEALQKEKEARILVEGKLMNLKDDLLEKMTVKEVELDESKVEIIRLKTKLRQISADKNIQDVYDSFEDDVKRLSNENSALRRRNLALEERLAAVDYNNHNKNQSTSKSSASRSKLSQSVDISSSDKWINENGGLSGGNASTLQTKLRNVSRENEALRTQGEKWKKKERLTLISDRAATETSNRIKSLNIEYRKIMKQLEAEREMNLRLQGEVINIKGQKSQLEENENFLKSERIRLMQSVRTLQSQVIEVVQDKKNVEKLNKFIEKHSTQHSSGNTTIPKKIYKPGTTGHHRDFLDFSEPPKTSSRKSKVMDTSTNDSCNDISSVYNNRKGTRASSPTPNATPTPHQHVHFEKSQMLQSQTTSGNPHPFNAYKSLLQSTNSNMPQMIKQVPPIWQD